MLKLAVRYPGGGEKILYANARRCPGWMVKVEIERDIISSCVPLTSSIVFFPQCSPTGMAKFRKR